MANEAKRQDTIPNLPDQTGKSLDASPDVFLVPGFFGFTYLGAVDPP